MNGHYFVISLFLASLLFWPTGCKTTQRAANETINSDAPPCSAPTIDSTASAPADNDELSGMFEADQGARMVEGEINWAIVSNNDAARRARVDEMLAAGRVRTGNDYFHAAMNFQHGMTPADYEKAHRFPMRVVELGSTNSADPHYIFIDYRLQPPIISARLG